MKKKYIYQHQPGKVFICSPFRPRNGTPEDRLIDLHCNQEMACLVCRYAVSLGYMPMAPHLFFPQFLSESDENEREIGIRYGLEWLSQCDELWVIGPRITEGMRREIQVAEELGLPIRQFTFYRGSVTCLVVDNGTNGK